MDLLHADIYLWTPSQSCQTVCTETCCSSLAQWRIRFLLTFFFNHCNVPPLPTMYFFNMSFYTLGHLYLLARHYWSTLAKVETRQWQYRIGWSIPESFTAIWENICGNVAYFSDFPATGRALPCLIIRCRSSICYKMTSTMGNLHIFVTSREHCRAQPIIKPPSWLRPSPLARNTHRAARRCGVMIQVEEAELDMLKFAYGIMLTLCCGSVPLWAVWCKNGAATSRCPPGRGKKAEIHVHETCTHHRSVFVNRI